MRRLWILLMLALLVGCSQPMTPQQKARAEREAAYEKAKQERLERLERKAERMQQRFIEQQRAAQQRRR